MKKMKRALTSMFGGLMGLLGLISGCSDDTSTSGTSGAGGTTGAYMGPPPSITGKVLNGSGSAPISNIRVELLKYDISQNTNRTDENGNFTFTLDYNDYNNDYALRITDTDGTENGGEFKGTTNTFHLDYSTNMIINLEERE